MRKLLDAKHNYEKTQQNVQNYLKSLSDSQLKLFYEAIEFTPFSILLSQEYFKRFGKKSNKKQIL